MSDQAAGTAILGLDDVTSEALLSALIDVKFLRRTLQDAYVRADVG